MGACVSRRAHGGRKLQRRPALGRSASLGCAGGMRKLMSARARHLLASRCNLTLCPGNATKAKASNRLSAAEVLLFPARCDSLKLFSILFQKGHM